MLKIAVVNSSSFANIFPEHKQRLKYLGKVKRFKVPIDISGKKLGNMLQGYDAIVASISPNYDKDFFKAQGGSLKLLARHGIGTNNIDLQAAGDFGVIVTKVPGIIEREAMAEHTVALMLTCLRNIQQAKKNVKEGKWQSRTDFVGGELRNRTVGIFGLGNIGSRVAEIVEKGFGAKVLSYDPTVDTNSTLSEIISNASVISLNCSLNPENIHMISEKELSKMSPKTVLINTARGELIDLKPLVKALKNKKIAAYGADVVEGEPIGKNHPLLKLKNVTIVPHIGAYTRESLRRMGDKMLDDLEAL